MNIKILKKNEIEYIKKYYTEQDIIESTPVEVANFLWRYFGSCMSLIEAQARYDEIIKM